MTKFTRRSMIAGATAFGIATTSGAVPAAGGPDPIYAAIKNYRRVHRDFLRFLSRLDKVQEAARDADGHFGELAPEWEVGEDMHGNADCDVASAFVTTTPTTLAGIIAALAFVRSEADRGNHFLDDEKAEQLAFSVERAACALAGLPVPAWEDDDADA